MPETQNLRNTVSLHFVNIQNQNKSYILLHIIIRFLPVVLINLKICTSNSFVLLKYFLPDFYC